MERMKCTQCGDLIPFLAKRDSSSSHGAFCFPTRDKQCKDTYYRLHPLHCWDADAMPENIPQLFLKEVDKFDKSLKAAMLRGLLLIALAALVLVGMSSVTAWSMTQEEIYYYFGLKSTGVSRVYEAVTKSEGIEHPDSPFVTIEECILARNEGYKSCIFTVEHLFESEEEMQRRYMELLNRGVPST